MPPLEILIVGCGIAGPTLASFLLLSPLPASQKPHITILERTSKVNNRGQNIDIRDKGIPIIRKLGIETSIRSSLTGEEGVRHVDEYDRAWTSIPVDKTGKIQGPTCEIEILRGRLAEICWERSRWISDRVKSEGGAGVQYIFGDEVQKIDQQGDQVHVTFKKSPSRCFDIIVGADGLQSQTRKMVWGSSPEEDRIARLGMYAGFFSIPRENSDYDWRRWFHAPGRKGIMLRPDGTGKRTTVMMHVINEKDKRFVEVASKKRPDVKEQKMLLEEYFVNAGWESERVIREMWKTNDFCYDAIGQVKMEKWSKGRVVLLGDAGYCASPFSGMGTTLAFNGAYHLAGAITNHLHDHTAAFVSYEKKMRPLVDRAQKLPPGIFKILNPETKWGFWLIFGTLRFFSLTKVFSLLFFLAGFFGTKKSEESIEDYGFEELSEWTDESKA